jgi:ABC-type multidrug transport system fused ATPase/permease subunit
MPADTTSDTDAKKPTSPKPLSDAELADQAERQSALLVLRKVAPYLWPAQMPWVKHRVVWAMVALVVSKLISVATPLFYKGAVDGLAGEGVPMLALGAIGLTVAYGVARLMTVGSTAVQGSAGLADAGAGNL